MTPIPTELRELLERIVAGDVGRMIYAKLATGQATETDDGKAWLELRALLATPPADAADMGGQAGEEVEVVAWRIEHPAKQWKVYEQRQDWAYQEYGHIKYEVQDLMTVAQHQRITAAMAAEVERLSRMLNNATNDGIKLADERDALLATIELMRTKQELIGYTMRSSLKPLMDDTLPEGKHIRIGVDHRVCWMDDTPYDNLIPLYVIGDV